MRSRSVRATLAALVVAALATACSSEEESSPAATAAPQASTTTTIGVDEVPEEITLDYVQRVMDAIDAAKGDMFRQFFAEKQVTDDVRSWMQELSTDEIATEDLWWLEQYVELGFTNIRDDPGNPVTVVEDLLHASQECIYLFGQHDIDAWLETPTAEEHTQAYFGLQRREPNESPGPRNPTAWEISAVAAGAEAVEDNPCVE